MKQKTADLQGQALDWAVAKCEYGDDVDYIYAHTATRNAYSTDWAQGGPIIEREYIDIKVVSRAEWCAVEYFNEDAKRHYGSTPLIAAMRAFVASKLGDEVDVPEELI